MKTYFCNECCERLTKKELEQYPIMWRYSGDMYCFKCKRKEAVQFVKMLDSAKRAITN